MGETEKSSKLSIGIIVLAAGASSRMKKPKQLLKFQGKTLLRRAALTAVETDCHPIIVVLGANYDQSRNEIKDLPIQICRNESFFDGLSSSIKVGLSELLKISPHLSAALIMLGDQPLVTTEHLNLLLAKFHETGANIVAAQYSENLGVPAIFSVKIFDRLRKLEGDSGARKIIAENSHFLEAITIPAAAFDIDTPHDFERLTKTEGNSFSDNRFL